MKNTNLPSVSFLIPTLNAARFLPRCLKAIYDQNYPPNKIEIVIADGGSTDQTLRIAKKYHAVIVKNPLKTGEAGKAVALNRAKSDLVALVDSDNILPDKNWLNNMIVPFGDREIIGSEPWQFDYRRGDGFIDRYCALIGANDPLCLFLGNYDRYSQLTGRWTDLPVIFTDQGDWLKINLKPPLLPTIGANGTIFRRFELQKLLAGRDYLFDIDLLASLSVKQPVKFAKVKIGIIHLFCGRDLLKFVRKQKRRIKDYLYYRRLKIRFYPWQQQNRFGLVKYVFACIFVLPLIFQVFHGYWKKPDRAWFFHLPACWLTLLVYGFVIISYQLFGARQQNRSDWKQ